MGKRSEQGHVSPYAFMRKAWLIFRSEEDHDRFQANRSMK